jgi:hypothetical protein
LNAEKVVKRLLREIVIAKDKCIVNRAKERCTGWDMIYHDGVSLSGALNIVT